MLRFNTVILDSTSTNRYGMNYMPIVVETMAEVKEQFKKVGETVGCTTEIFDKRSFGNASLTNGKGVILILMSV